MHRRRPLALPLLAALLLTTTLACGDEPLSEEAVTSIPPGDAVGTALTGDVGIEWTTVACEGICARVKVSAVESLSVCDVGFRQSTTGRLTQTDGRLQLDVDRSLFASRLVGGVNRDGSFDIGGLKTELGQELRLRTRVTGNLAGGALAEARTQSTGRADTPDQRCESRHELRIVR
jgi:hypothetical protein